jgi:NTP pyrophosphatase (non-canonical NTP hydrolase)
MKDYIAQAVRTEAPITDEVIKRLTCCARLLHAAMGMETEVGEFTDQLKKHIFYGKPLDFVNLLEEIGDKFWYVALALDFIEDVNSGSTFESVQERNIAKLRKRYPDKFTEYDALNRDLEAERKELEGEKSTFQGVPYYEVVGGPYPPPKPDIVRLKEGAIRTSEPKKIVSGDEVIVTYDPGSDSLDSQITLETRGAINSPYFVAQRDNLIGTKFIVLPLDHPDEKMRHSAWLAGRMFAKELYYDEKLRQLSNKIEQMLIAVQEEEPPLKS